MIEQAGYKDKEIEESQEYHKGAVDAYVMAMEAPLIERIGMCFNLLFRRKRMVKDMKKLYNSWYEVEE